MDDNTNPVHTQSAEVINAPAEPSPCQRDVLADMLECPDGFMVLVYGHMLDLLYLEHPQPRRPL